MTLKKNVSLLLVVFFSVAPLALWAMQEAPSPRLEITGVNPTQLPTVTVTTNVFDDRGQPVSDLGVEHFTLSGELAGKASLVSVQNITDDNLAFAAVLVIDTSSSMGGLPFERAKEAAKAFINAIGPADPVAIISFSTDPFLNQDFTTDKSALLATVDSLVYGGKTALYDAAMLGVQKAADSPLPGRPVVMVLLSDGAEYGGVSENEAGAALNEARIRGVPVYTIGLGYGAPRVYLRELSGGSNARYYESPTPNELVEIYSGLAALLRSQYVLTLSADVPADGTEYTLTVKATTPSGDTNEATAIVRAPIPIPLVSFPALPDEPISAPTEITASVAADDAISDVAFTLDGESIEGEEMTVSIDPMQLLPGSHQLALTVTDDNGDAGTATLDFEVAALPSEVTLVSALGEGEISTPQTVTLDVAGQTPVESVTYTLDGEAAATTNTAPYEFSIDPFNLAPGEHTLDIEVLNEAQVTTTVSQAFQVAALPPLVAVTGLEAGQSVSGPVEVFVDALGQTQVTDIAISLNSEEAVHEADSTTSYTIDPMLLSPGPSNLSITVTVASGQSATQDIDFVVAALPPVVTLVGLESDETLDENRMVILDVVSQTPVSGVSYSIDGAEAASPTEAPYSFEMDVLQIGPGDHLLSVTVSNEGGQDTTVEVPFNVPEGPSLTATASVPTNTPLPTDTAIPSNTPRLTNTSVPPSDTPVRPTNTSVPPTNTPRPTNTPVPPTNTPRPTSTPVPPTDTPVPPTNTPRPTRTPAESATPVPPTATATVDRTATAQAVAQQPTGETPAQTPTVRPTFTPLPITEVVAESAPEQAANTQTILLIGAIALVILLVLFLLLRGRGQTPK